MDRNTFEVLAALQENGSDGFRSELAGRYDLSAAEVESILLRLTEAGLVSNGKVTPAGVEALEPYRVKRAIFMAAGFGSRLVPVTLNTPKPLVRVNGTRMIDTVLDAVVAAGIEQIVVVRGYLAEQFDQLLYKYPGIRFVDNPMYNQANNISSVMVVRELLENAYVMEADLVLNNPKLIRKYQYNSNFLGIKVDSSADWCFVVKDGIITKQLPNGSEYKSKLQPDEQMYQQIGISYWSAEDGEKLAEHIKTVFDSDEGKKRYWEQVQFLDYADSYQVGIRPCKETDIVEIDSYKELVAIDRKYAVDL